MKRAATVGRTWIGTKGKVTSVDDQRRPVPEGCRPWAEIVAERVTKREQTELAMTPEQYAEHRLDKCSALTSGTYGPQRPCDNKTMVGQTVCGMHGGSAKHTKAAARKRIMEEVFPTITRLTEIRDQDGHMPSALGASKELLNRAMGKPEATQGQLGAGAPIILIGMRLGALPVQLIEANQQKQLTESSDKEDSAAIEGEVVANDELRDPFDE